MRESQEIQNLISIFNEHKHPSTVETVKQFLSKWQQFAEDQAKTVEQNYIRQLVQGYLNEQGMQNQSQLQRQSQTIKITDWKANWEDHLSKKNVYLKVSNDQAIIRVEQCVYFINPTRNTSKFALELEADRYPLYLVITNSNLNSIMNLFSTLKQRKFQRIITSQHIYRKMLTLDCFFIHNNILNYENIFRDNKVGLLKEAEYFQYGRLLWKITTCCWYETVYDLEIKNRKDMHLLVEGPKIKESKAIYTGWKKNFISQQNYQKYTAQTEQKQSQTKDVILFQVEEETMQTKIGKKYLNFIKKEVLRQLDDEEQEDLWECCEELHYTKGQVIIKRGTQCDFIYALEKGDFQICIDNSVKNADKQILYGLQDMKNKQKRHTFDLISKTDSIVQRIRVENMQFHLYQYFSQFK